MKRTALATAILAGVLSTAAHSGEDGDALKRIERLEQELKALKAQLAAEKVKPAKPAVAMKPEPEKVKATGGSSITFGGYLKADFRHVSGDLGYQDYWRGNNPGSVPDTKHTGFNVKETRFNTKYTKGDFTAFVEMDFYGGSGNEVATNSTNPRLRHAFIKYKNWTVGQYWTAFTPIKAFPEALDFAGPIVGEVFVRQPQIRYSSGNFTVSVENPETWGDGDVGINGVGGGQGAAGADPDESLPDLIFTYNFAGDWGSVQAGTLIRKVDEGGLDETAVAFNVGGRLNVGNRNDLRFQLNLGESGRYVGAGMINDIVPDFDTGMTEVEETTAYMASYRHFWSDLWRSNIYYGAADSDHLEIDRSHLGVNLIRQIGPTMTAGVEYGCFDVNDRGGIDASSDYFQFSWKYGL